ncbi:MAG: zinc ribbon domain-containing protein [Nanoarchaeota archaeon]|nr:zinc ribbon domain-containing protein [Nanoarchaeota archaeon]
MGSCLDLRKYQDADAVESAFAKIVSGKSGYKPVIERRIDPVKCDKCGKLIEGTEKFCPDCGNPIKRKPTSTKCKKCNNFYNDEDTFCSECGTKRE